jgi:hypothetical protein
MLKRHVVLSGPYPRSIVCSIRERAISTLMPLLKAAQGLLIAQESHPAA